MNNYFFEYYQNETKQNIEKTLQIIRLLNSNNLLMKVDGYARWNTSANTVGIAITEAVESYHFKLTQKHQDFWELCILKMQGIVL